MVNVMAMMTPLQEWRRTGSAAGRRFGIGLMVGLSVVLAAFEWRSSAPAFQEWTYLDLEAPLDPELQVMFASPKQEAPRQKLKNRGSGPIRTISDPLPDDGPVDDLPDDPVSGGADAATDSTSREQLNPPEQIETAVLPWKKGREDMPYFLDCEDNRRMDRHECTELRIQRHLDRNFRVPDGLRKEEFTVVSFEIATDGSIGQLVCRPRPSDAVEREVERVIRLLPAFKPGMQNDHPVRVIYQIPLRVKRESH